MNADKKRELGIPTTSLVHVDFEDNAIFVTEDIEVAFTFYVDETVLTQAQDPRSKQAQLLALMLVRQAAGGLVKALELGIKGTPDIEELVNDVEAKENKSVGAKAIRNIKKLVKAGSARETNGINS